MDKMTLVCLKHTGHVLAGVVQAAGEPDLADLVGADLPIAPMRRIANAVAPDWALSLPASVLETKSVAFDATTLAWPQSYVADGATPVKIPDASVAAPTLGAATITINFPGGVAPADTKVFAAVLGIENGERRVQQGKILSGPAPVALPLTGVPDGPPATISPPGATNHYAVAIAIAGFPLAYFRIP